MLALDTVSRTLLAAAAFAAFAGAFVTTPIVAHGAGSVVADPLPPVTPLSARTAFADVMPQRDPFSGGDPPAAPSGAAAPPSPVTVPVPPQPPFPAALRPLPPNAGAGDGAFPFATATHSMPTVTAVITGPHPFALVDASGTTRVMTIGDAVDGAAIVAIGGDGVRLVGGTLLPLVAHPISGGR